MQGGPWSTGGHVYNCVFMTGETGEWRSVGTGLQVDMFITLLYVHDR